MQLKNLKPLKRVTRRPLLSITSDIAQSENLPDSPQKSPVKTVPQVSRQLQDLRKELYALLTHPKLIKLPRSGKVTGLDLSNEEGGNTDQPQTEVNIPSASSQLARQAAYVIKLKNDLEQVNTLIGFFFRHEFNT